MNVLALDFDGVISDSAPEAFVVALRTYVALYGGVSGVLGPDLEGLEQAGLERPVVVSSRLYPDFVDFMPLGNRAEDFGVVLAALARGRVLRDQGDYDEYKQALEASRPDFSATFHERFYRERNRFAERDPQRWLALMGPYPDFLALLRRRSKDRTLAIATAKDRASVDRLLGHYGIADLFPADKVLDKETGSSKRAHLLELARRLAAPLERIVFVDDKVNHLEDVSSLGVCPVLAAWGYNGSREQERARTHGFDVCHLGEAEHVLFDRVELPSG